MPRYYFHVQDGITLVDKLGEELPDLGAAKLKAVEISGQLLASKPDTFWRGEQWSLDVCDASNLILFTLQFTATVAPAISALHPDYGGRH